MKSPAVIIKRGVKPPFAETYHSGGLIIYNSTGGNNAANNIMNNNRDHGNPTD